MFAISAKKCKGENEEFSSCGTACPLTCDNKDDNFACIALCVEGCFCKKGYVRDKNNKCILPENCPKKCKGENEEFNSCGTACPLTCDNKDSKITCTLQCVEGCFCKKGYVRDKNNKCILPENCPKKCKGENEEFNSCGTACPLTCDNKDSKITCTLQCVEGCFCKKGYVRDKNNKCILPENCPKKCKGENEEFNSCGTACPLTCDNKDSKITCTLQCVEGCFCKKGYVRDKNNKCILPENCPKKCKGENEEFNSCGTACPLTCDNKDSKITCTLQCVEGCFCKKGYVRDKNNKCILPENCPKKCKGENEEFNSCGTACPLTCDNKDSKITCTLQCVEGCFCKKGYVRDKNNKCILPENCPKKCKGENEEFNSCGTACPLTCDNKDSKITCTLQCVEGCFCKKGYVRDKNNKCILPENCPKKCKGENEEFSSCGTACPRTCDNKDQNIGCIKLCVEGCFCKKGYVRDKNNKCILPENCPIPMCGYAQKYDGCPPCRPPEETCHDIFQGNKPCHPDICKPGCKCIPGYVRNDKNECVRRAKCCTDFNAELVENANACPGGTCQHPEYECCDAPNKPAACVCREGYLKKSADDETCIPIDECCKCTDSNEK